MNKQDKNRRAHYRAEQERKAKRLMKWLMGGLLALAVLYMLYTLTVVG